MRFGTSRNRVRAGLAAGVALAGGLLLGATPASAGNFERAFEFELGRLMAHEVVRAGHLLIGSYAVAAHPPVRAVPVYPRPRYRPAPPPAYGPPVAYGPPPAPCGREHVVYERYERTVTPRYGPVYYERGRY